MPMFVYRYEKELRVEYLVQCEEDELAFYNITSLDTQSKEDCQSNDGNYRYIIISICGLH